MYFTFACNARMHSHASFSEEAQIKNAYYEMHFMWTNVKMAQLHHLTKLKN